ncbi:MAG: response regulator [Proteobacteria bacterium]|nr:response regulator [Pseudomonadota bacterium]MBI3496692.1 response regulator [Pseudomonadota bacterium]
MAGKTEEAPAPMSRRVSCAERKLLDVLAITNDVYVELDRERTIVDVSPRVEQLIGVRPDQIIGRKSADLPDPSLDDDGVLAFRHAFERRVPFRDLVVPIVLPGSKHFWIRMSGVPVFDEDMHGTRTDAHEPAGDEAFRGFRCMASDVTSFELARLRLAQQERMLAMGQLVGGIAHDFNNLLAAIIGFSALLQEDLRGDAAKHGLLERIIQAGHGAKELIERLLSFARRSNAAPERLRLADVVNEVLLRAHSAVPAVLRIKTRIDISNEAVVIAHSELIELVANLCANAGDAYRSASARDEAATIQLSIGRAPPECSTYRLLAKSALTSPERVSVTSPIDGTQRIFVSHLDPARSYVRLMVADAGCGIAPEILPRVFDPYFTTKDVGQGSGLGFSVVHGIVLAAGGALCLTTARGKGTTVEVFLPVAEPDAAAATPQIANASATARVLMAEDRLEVGELNAMALERAGMTVRLYGNGKDAWKAFAADPDAWDVVFADQGMADLKGIDLVHRVKGLRPATPCVIYSGSSDMLSEAAARRAGVDAYLRKPVLPGVLQAEVARLIARKRRLN